MLRKLLIALSVLFLAGSVYGASNEYGDVQAWVNNLEAPAKNISAKVGQVLDVQVQVRIKKDAYGSLALSSPGFGGNPKQPYVTVEGPSQFDKSLEFDGVKKAGETVDLKWKLKVTDSWAGGTAPINLDVGFSDAKTVRSYPLSMSVATIYIEPAGGSQPAPAAATPRQPGFEIALAALSLLGLGVAIRRRK